jgi:hypothetical protein
MSMMSENIVKTMQGLNIWYRLRYLFFVVRKALKRAWSKSAPFLFVIMAAAGVGYGIATQTPIKIIGTVLSVVACIWLANKIDWGVLVILGILTVVAATAVIPKPITIAGQGMGINEFLLTYLLLVVVVKCMADGRMDLFRSPLAWSLILFFLAVVLSIAASYQNNLSWNFHDIYNGVRCLFGYTLFFVVAFGLRTERQIKTVLYGTVVVGVIIAVLTILQFYIGTKLNIFGSSVRVIAVSEEDETVTRVIPPGILLSVCVACVSSYLASVSQSLKMRLVYGVVSLVVGAGLVLTFTRSVWGSLAIAVLVMFIIADRDVRKKLVVLIVTLPVVAVLGTFLVSSLSTHTTNSQFATALSNRFDSVVHPEKAFMSGSYQARLKENELALKHANGGSMFGIGPGRPLYYQNNTILLLTGRRLPSVTPGFQLHNCYVEFLVVLGYFGLSAFILVSLVFLVRSFLLFRRLTDLFYKAVVGSFLAVYVGLLWEGWVAMFFTHQDAAICLVSIMWGLVEVIARLERRDGSQELEVA